MARPQELRNVAKFDSSRELVANRGMTLSGYRYERGEDIKREGGKAANPRALPRFWASFRVVYKEEYSPIATAKAPVVEPKAETPVKAPDPAPAVKDDTSSAAVKTDIKPVLDTPTQSADAVKPTPKARKGKAKKDT